MKNTSKLLVIFIVTLVFFLSFNGVYASTDITIKIDDKIVDFGVSPEVVNERVMVPFRGIFEQLGSSYINWDQSTKEIQANLNGNDIRLKLGSSQAYVNHASKELDAPVISRNDRTLVPIRFISETAGCDVEWISRTKTVNITSKLSNDKMENQSLGLSLRLGQSLADLERVMGQPDRVETSSKKYKLHIYNSNENFNDYIQVGVNNDKIVALRTNASNWVYNDSIRIGKTLEKDDKKESDFYENKNASTVRLYKDKHADYVVSTIIIQDSYFAGINEEYTVKLARDFERQALEITNVYRARHGLKPLKWNEKLASVAYLHSSDMVENNYFNHTSPRGISMSDRIKRANIDYWAIGENISMGYVDALASVNGLYNSLGHRDNMLGNYNELGVGIAFNAQNRMYLTQNFLSSR